MSNLKTLYVTDLDGTLLNDQSVISSESRRLLNYLTAEGALITFATARTPATVSEIFEGVKLNIPGIVMTGAAIYDLSTGVYEKMHFLAPEIVLPAIEVLENAGIKPFVYTWRPDNVLHAFHTETMTVSEENFYKIRRDKRFKKFHLDEFPTADDVKHTLLIFSVGKRDILMPLLSKLEEIVGYKATYYNDIFSPDNGFIEVFARNVSKANAITELKKNYDIERVVAFGDNLNDLSMFSVADVSVAVSNSYEQVKEKADVIIGSNNDNAVAEYIINDYFNN